MFKLTTYEFTYQVEIKKQLKRNKSSDIFLILISKKKLSETKQSTILKAFNYLFNLVHMQTNFHKIDGCTKI